MTIEIHQPEGRERGAADKARKDDPGPSVAPLTQTDGFVSVIRLPDGYALLPITLSIAQVCSWTGLGKSKTQELINSAELITAKVDGRTLVLTASVISLVERNRVARSS